MISFKDFAYKILLEAKKPLHYEEITKIALKQWLVTDGKTPAATMCAQLVVDTNTKKEQSRFIKVWPWTYTINSAIKNITKKIGKKKSRLLLSLFRRNKKEILQKLVLQN